jgi:hypothetical protein
MGYRGKLREQEEARRLRASGKTLLEIAEQLHVAKSSVSTWVRDVPYTPSKRRNGPQARFHPWKARKLAEIEECDRIGREMIGQMDDAALLAAGVALYAGEGSKRDGAVTFANTDGRMVALFCAWLRRFFRIDEQRLRARVYLHEGLDLDAAEDHWSNVTGIPRAQFGKPYRAIADPTMRSTKHEMGCVYVSYNCSRTHRIIVGLMNGLLSSEAIPG